MKLNHFQNIWAVFLTTVSQSWPLRYYCIESVLLPFALQPQRNFCLLLNLLILFLLTSLSLALTFSSFLYIQTTPTQICNLHSLGNVCPLRRLQHLFSLFSVSLSSEVASGGLLKTTQEKEISTVNHCKKATVALHCALMYWCREVFMWVTWWAKNV